LVHRHSNLWGILAAVSLVLFLGSIDGSVVNVALPTLTEKLAVDFALVRWVVLAYVLSLTVLMVGAGRLADMLGKRLVFATGLTLFLLGSVLCGLAPGIYWLIGFRAFQAMGAAMMLAVGVPIITETWPPARRGLAIGIASGFLSIGIVVGPILGATLLNWLSWRWIFFVNLPFGLAAAWLIWRYVPPLRPAESHGGFDWMGAVALGVALLSLSVGLTLGETGSFLASAPLSLFLVSLLAALLFILIEARVRHPMVDLSLFRSSEFSLNLFSSWIVFTTLAGVVLMLPFYLQFALRLDVMGMGLLMAVVPIAIGAIQPIAGAVSDRIGARPLIVLGLAMLVVGYLAMSTLRADGTPWGFIVRLLPVAVGVAAFYSPNNSAIMGAAPRTRLGVAGGIVSMVRTLGQVIGVALLGAFFNGRLQQHGGRGSDLASAPPDAIVLALRDQFWMVAVIMAMGLGVTLWVWRGGILEKNLTRSREDAE
jgi:EmrB/QacA subfamily drug resistance transporter